MIKLIPSQPFKDQRPGTSGLRKKVVQFQQTHYLENFIQAIFDSQNSLNDGILLVGGDGRFYNRTAIQIIIRMAAAHGVKQVLVAQNGILSTPAASCIIRRYKAQGALILSASHNPGGPDKDFGIKYNVSNGGPAPESVTEAIYQKSLTIQAYKILESEDIDLSAICLYTRSNTQVNVIDTMTDYCHLMQDLFDFDAISKLLKSKAFSMRFDAMHAVTGPYAKKIFEQILGAKTGTVINGIPQEDFAGGHPDPNPIHAAQLVNLTQGDNGIDFAAASDGDGDRNMILGKNFFVTPSDSLAIIVANAHLMTGYQKGISGVARSMPTSQALDQVAKKLNIPCYETPTGWKFFGNLLDHGKIVFCGEESFGTSSDHIREKDGIWAVLSWLNLLAIKQTSVATIVQKHWQNFGRNYYTRHDYEGINSQAADKLMQHLRAQCGSSMKTHIGNKHIRLIDDFSYKDPIDQSISVHQGIRFLFDDDSRIIFRLSGTGTDGATLRVYLESYETDITKQQLETADVMQPLVILAQELAQITAFTGRTEASLVT